MTRDRDEWDDERKHSGKRPQKDRYDKYRNTIYEYEDDEDDVFDDDDFVVNDDFDDEC